MNEKSQSVDNFFDSLTPEYTELIERCYPRYREMLWALLDYLPANRSCQSILELGCGTGNLSVLLSEMFPESTIRLVDIASDSLTVCRERLEESSRFEFEVNDLRNLEYEASSFDLILASISIHHIDASEKQQLFSKIRNWLTPDGVFQFADQFRGATDDLYQRHIANWKALSLNAGSTEDEFEMWMEHQREHDHHDTLWDQIDWLKNSEFPVVDCVWRHLLWGVVQARKN